MSADLRFVTKNDGKFRELKALLSTGKINLIRDGTPINEIQTEDIDLLVRSKVLEAYKQIRRPLIIDHTGLYFDLLKNFPGGLTDVFWERLKEKGFAEFIGKSRNPKVTAVTVIGYCDGRRIRIFKGSIRGAVADCPRGTQGFQWDNVFIPAGYSQTFAELGNKKKNEISMRRKAFDKLIKFLAR